MKNPNGNVRLQRLSKPFAKIGFVLLLPLVLSVSPLAFAQDGPPKINLDSLQPAKVQTNLPIRELEGGILQINELRVDKEKRTVTFPGKVNLREDLIEYLLVCQDGKAHEAVFTTKVEPYEIHVGMLLLGARGAPNWQPNDADDSKVLKGDKIRIWIEWAKDGKKERHPAENFIHVGRDRHPIEAGDWIYNGSWKWGARFIAQEERSLAALIADPAALANNPRPERSNDEIWFARTENLPPLGADVTVIYELKETATWK